MHTGGEFGLPERGEIVRRFVTLVALLAVVLVVAYAAGSVVVYNRLSTIASTCEQDFAANSPASFALTPLPGVAPIDTTPYLMPQYRDVSFPARGDGVTIHGWLVPGPSGRLARAVILVHGLGDCRRQDRDLLAAGMLHEAGFATLLIDLRNHGESDRDDGRYAAGVKEYRDVLGAWDWLVAQGVRPGRIGLWGESLGAATALIAAGEEPRVAAVWEDSGYADLEEAIRAELTRNGYPTLLAPGGILAARVLGGVDLTSKSPIAAARRLDGRPLFITHGTADARLSVTYATELADAVRATGGTVQPWIVAGAGHVEAILRHPTEYQQRLGAFFGSALAVGVSN